MGLSTVRVSFLDLDSVTVPICLYGLGDFLSPLGIPALSASVIGLFPNLFLVLLISSWN